jgi:hypothetical protein
LPFWNKKDKTEEENMKLHSLTGGEMGGGGRGRGREVGREGRGYSIRIGIRGSTGNQTEIE